ncbi:MAG: glutamate dehydrogenase, partial [Candidatus Aminicenantes bacterium]|nr:glutamate dehydrogenase [Candidatus Aminicenantes bacterium]
LWNHKADVAFPSATQNEINAKDAQNLVSNGAKAISEGANMPTTPEGIKVFMDSGILYGLGKAANAGGVAVSGLEMSQNSLRLSWSREEVDNKLKGIMHSIQKDAYETSKAYGDPGNFPMGANIAGFTKVAKAMLAYGVV